MFGLFKENSYLISPTNNCLKFYGRVIIWKLVSIYSCLYALAQRPNHWDLCMFYTVLKLGYAGSQQICQHYFHIENSTPKLSLLLRCMQGIQGKFTHIPKSSTSSPFHNSTPCCVWYSPFRSADPAGLNLFGVVGQCFSTAGPQPSSGPWHQLYWAARGSSGICHFHFLSTRRIHRCTNTLYDYAIINY
jgi:hypothetical protein